MAIRWSIRELLTAVAAVSCILAGFIADGLFGASSITLLVGALLIFRGRRESEARLTHIGVAISVPSLCTLSVLLAAWLLFGIGPIYSAAAMPYEFKRMVDVANARTGDAKVAGLGSFLDTEYVWRLSLSPDQLDQVVAKYRLEAVQLADVPEPFWLAFPRWWRPSHNSSCCYLSTPNFPARSRGSDGDHCFTMYDANRQWLYVWHNFNF